MKANNWIESASGVKSATMESLPQFARPYEENSIYIYSTVMIEYTAKYYNSQKIVVYG